MSVKSGPIVVGTDGSATADDALRWAVHEARFRTLPLRMVYAYRGERRWAPDYDELSDVRVVAPHDAAAQVVAGAMNRAYGLDRDVEVVADAVEGEPVQVLLGEAESATELVLGSRQRKTLGAAVLGSVSAAVAARAACPVVVMRGPADMTTEDAMVVVGVDGTDWADIVLAFAFEQASLRQVPLRVVLCWHPRSRSQAETWLSETLAGWRLKYPDVAVHVAVVREHPVTGLVQLSRGQRLLVVGSRGRPARVGTLLGSVSQGVLHHASCPVAVVPMHRR